MNFAKLVIAALVTVVASAATAADAKGSKKTSLHDQFSGQSYGMAGCGLGSVVFGDKPGMIQIIAATLNGTSGNQTFGITSGTSNCGESGKAAKAQQFIETNKVVLEKDISRGEGETLSSLSQLLECKNGNFPADLRKNYNSSFPQGGASADALHAVAYKSCQI